MLRWYGTLATGMLALAAATGVLLRFGVYRGMPAWALNFSAVRHAHSHLMYFGWVTLGLMALIWHFLPGLTGRPRPRGAGVQMAVSALFALGSFPAFWSNGYGLTQIGDRSLPLGSIVSGLNGLGWFAFVALYVRATAKLGARSLPLRLWDWGLALMLTASLGALGLAGMVALNLTSAVLQQLFLHLFLDLFGIGWFTLGLLGALGAALLPDGGWPGLPVEGLALALAPTFMLGMSPLVVTPAMFWTAAAANLFAAVCLARHLGAFWQRRAALPWLLRFAGGALAIYLAASAVVMWPGVWRWSAGTQLRVFWLHNFLLGWISSGLLGLIFWTGPGAARSRLARGAQIVWMVGVAMMVAALAALGLTQFVPGPPLLWLRVAAWSSLLPAGVALWSTVALGRRAAAGEG